jgi:hypothetical protein
LDDSQRAQSQQPTPSSGQGPTACESDASLARRGSRRSVSK